MLDVGIMVAAIISTIALVVIVMVGLWWLCTGPEERDNYRTTKHPRENRRNNRL